MTTSSQSAPVAPSVVDNGLPLAPEHVTDLRASGLADAVIREMGVYSLSPA
jgi:hypothetical protein